MYNLFLFTLHPYTTSSFRPSGARQAPCQTNTTFGDRPVKTWHKPWQATRSRLNQFVPVCQPQQKLLLCWFHDLLKSTIISLWCNAIICLLSQDYDLLPRSIISTTIWCCFFYSAVTVTVWVCQCVDCGAGGPVLLIDIVIDLWILSIDWWMIQHTEI